MKVSDLKAGATTDVLVAMAQGWRLEIHSGGTGASAHEMWHDKSNSCVAVNYHPTTKPAQWAELIERFEMRVGMEEVDVWEATAWRDFTAYKKRGSTPALAICKAVIASKWGDTIPEEIMEQVK